MLRHHALRVPAGWMVSQNHFLEIDPSDAVTEDGRLDFPFYEDILQLSNESKRMTLDLGWYPDGDPDGKFRLCLIQWDAPPQHDKMPKQTIAVERNGFTYTYGLKPMMLGDAWSKPLIDFESRDANAIREKINGVLELVSQGKVGLA